jgi:hypothetical protein
LRVMKCSRPISVKRRSPTSRNEPSDIVLVLRDGHGRETPLDGHVIEKSGQQLADGRIILHSKNQRLIG